jgi:hypothetical protein
MGIFDKLKDLALLAEYKRQRLIEDSDARSEEINQKFFPKMGDVVGMSADMAGATQGITRTAKEAMKLGASPEVATSISKAVKDIQNPKYIGNWTYREPTKMYKILKEAKDKLFKEDFDTLKELSHSTIRGYNADLIQQGLKRAGVKSSTEDFITSTHRPFGHKIYDEEFARKPVKEKALEILKGKHNNFGLLGTGSPDVWIERAAKNLKKRPIKPKKSLSKQDLISNLDYERKALDIYAKGVKKNRDIIYGSEKMDELLKEQGDLFKYAKEKALKLKNFNKYFKKENLPVKVEEPSFPKQSVPEFLNPKVNQEDISRAFKALQNAQIKAGNFNAGSRLSADPVKDFMLRMPKVKEEAPDFMTQQLEKVAKIPTPEQLAKADRLRRAFEFDEAAAKPTSTMADAGTLLKPNQRAGYQKWKAAQKGMKMNFKKGSK